MHASLNASLAIKSETSVATDRFEGSFSSPHMPLAGSGIGVCLVHGPYITSRTSSAPTAPPSVREAQSG